MKNNFYQVMQINKNRIPFFIFLFFFTIQCSSRKISNPLEKIRGNWLQVFEDERSIPDWDKTDNGSYMIIHEKDNRIIVWHASLDYSYQYEYDKIEEIKDSVKLVNTNNGKSEEFKIINQDTILPINPYFLDLEKRPIWYIRANKNKNYEPNIKNFCDYILSEP